MITIYYDCAFLNSKRVSIVFCEQMKEEALVAIKRGGSTVTAIKYETKWSVYDYLIASSTETPRQLPDMQPDIPDNLPDNDMLAAMAFVAKMKESADRIGAGFVGGFTAPDGTKFVMTNMNEEDTTALTPQSLRESND